MLRRSIAMISALTQRPPALDRAFGTIDFFIIVDIGRLSGRLYRMFFADLPDDQTPRPGEPLERR